MPLFYCRLPLTAYGLSHFHIDLAFPVPDDTQSKILGHISIGKRTLPADLSCQMLFIKASIELD